MSEIALDHIHIDPVGGIAGDMFVAAMLDAFPEHAEAAIAAVRAAGLAEDITLAHVPHDDGVLTGSRFEVKAPQGAHLHHHQHDDDPDHDHQRDDEHPHDHGHHHAHTHWSTLRRQLADSVLAPPVRERAIAIFSHLAQAEARVHGKPVDDVSFHEVGNWDSIADIVAAAFLIHAVDVSSWSIGSLPLGSGRVNTAHGELPVPAPATSLLLEGFICHDDGRAGERVTPTGAAIVRYLAPQTSIGALPRRLARGGYGFGTRRLEGMSNMVRILAFAPANAHAAGSETIGVIEFEVDDQSGEDLAEAVMQLRAESGVVEVMQMPVYGKKGRIMTSVRLLTRVDALDAVADACFLQTTTLGLRTRLESRRVLQRRELTLEDGMKVKIASRPGGDSAKADIDAVSDKALSHRERESRRRAAEEAALITSTDPTATRILK